MKDRLPLLTLILGAVLGLLIGYWLYGDKRAPVEPPASAIRQKDGSLVLERRPDSAPGTVPHQLPPGSKEERRVSLSIKPHWSLPPAASGPLSSAGGAPISSVTSPASNGTACPPVRVDLSLVRMPDQTRRVVASSPDGDVVGGLDVPIERERRARELRWAAGGTYDPAARTWGGFLERDLGPFRIGIEAHQERPAGAAARVMVGVRW